MAPYCAQPKCYALLEYLSCTNHHFYHDHKKLQEIIKIGIASFQFCFVLNCVSVLTHSGHSVSVLTHSGHSVSVLTHGRHISRAPSVVRLMFEEWGHSCCMILMHMVPGAIERSAKNSQTIALTFSTTKSLAPEQ